MSQTDNYNQGLSLFEQGRYADALELLVPLSHLPSLFSRLAKLYCGKCHRAAGIEFMATGDFQAAERHLHAAVETVGRSSELATYLASLYATTDRYPSCVRETEKAVALDPDDPQMHRRLAMAQWRDGNRAGSYMTIEGALRMFGDDSTLHMQLGLFHAAEGRYPQARVSLQEAIQADRVNAAAHYNLALAAAAEGDVTAALRSFQRAYELSPADLIFAHHLSLAAKAAQQEGHAVSLRLPDAAQATGGSEMQQLAACVCNEPEFIEAFLELGETDADQMIFGLLAEVLECALAEHPAYADLNYQLSRVLLRLGRIDEAIDRANRAVAINPNYVNAIVHLGRLYALKGNCHEAAGNLQRGISLGGDWADVHFLAGKMLQKTNKSEDAVWHFERALKLNPEYVKAEKALAKLAA